MPSPADDIAKTWLYDAEISMKVAQKRAVEEAKNDRRELLIVLVLGYMIGKGSRGR